MTTVTPCMADPAAFDYRQKGERVAAWRLRRDTAVAACGTCPLLETCAETAHPGAAGIIAGRVLAPDINHTYETVGSATVRTGRGGRPLTAAPDGPAPPGCGTLSGYARRRCRCQWCRYAMSQYQLQRNRKRLRAREVV